jgi:hypothetical protein
MIGLWFVSPNSKDQYKSATRNPVRCFTSESEFKFTSQTAKYSPLRSSGFKVEGLGSHSSTKWSASAGQQTHGGGLRNQMMEGIKELVGTIQWEKESLDSQRVEMWSISPERRSHLYEKDLHFEL